MKNQVKFYTLLYYDTSSKDHVNVKETGDKAFDLYVLNAVGAVRSAKEFGIDLSIITNDAKHISDRLSHYQLNNINVIQYDFEIDLPLGIRFRTAHYKLELIKVLGSGNFGNIVGIIDNDIAFTSLPNLKNARNKLMSYNIEIEYPGSPPTQDIKNLTDHKIKNPTWYGGEFLAGPSVLFKELYTIIEEILPPYLQALNENNILHVGSEPVHATALNLMQERTKDSVMPVRKRGLIIRYWSSRSPVRQKNYKEASKNAILHLPSDKPFLAKYALSNKLYKDFKKYYAFYLTTKIIPRILLNLMDKLLGKKPKYAPRLY